MSARLLVGDVTNLAALGLGDGYTLLLDAGCYYGLAASQRDAYVAGVTAIAAPGALLLLLGFTWPGVPGRGVSAAELTQRFRGWELLDAGPVPGPEMRAYYGGPPLPRALIGRGWLKIERYRLRRPTSASD